MLTARLRSAGRFAQWHREALETSNPRTMMKKLLIAACAVGFFLLPHLALGQPGCTASVEASVELSSGAFSLADLLGPDACPALRRAASHVPLGNAPLPGSVRVIEG